MLRAICTSYLACLFAVLTLQGVSWAQPTLSVSDNGLVGLNRQWLVEVAPDPALFSNGLGSLEIELAFEVLGSELVGAAINPLDWVFNNPGNNPFTGTTTFGLQTDLANDTVFVSLGSGLFITGDAVPVMTIETMGSAGTTLSWGGHTLLPGTAFQYVGSRIAQAGSNYDAYQGSLTVGNVVTGDFTGPGGTPDGVWDCSDIDALTEAVANGSADLAFDMNGDGAVTLADVTEPGTGWLAVGGANNPAATGGNPFLVGDATLDGTVDGQDFIRWNDNKFTSNTHWCSANFSGDQNVDGQDFVAWNNNKFMSSDVLSVPEPTAATIGLLTSLFVLCSQARKTRRSD
jgi:hypothetical protein